MFAGFPPPCKPYHDASPLLVSRRQCANHCVVPNLPYGARVEVLEDVWILAAKPMVSLVNIETPAYIKLFAPEKAQQKCVFDDRIVVRPGDFLTQFPQPLPACRRGLVQLAQRSGGQLRGERVLLQTQRHHNSM